MRRSVVPVMLGALATLPAATPVAQGPSRAPVRIFAAGSLTAPLTAVAEALKRAEGIDVEFTFGPSGGLRQRLERGDPADLFASANMEHPEALRQAGRSGPVQLFTRNTLCAFSRPDVRVTPDTLLDRLLDPRVKLGTSTPISDPAGDYTWLMFRKADGLRPGAYETLNGKARQLFGGPGPAPAPAVPRGRNATAFHLETRTVDVYLQYCSGRAAFLRDSPSFLAVPLPPALDVGADYGLTVLNGASSEAAKVAAFILSPRGQQIFTDSGFAAVGLPGSAP